MMAGSGVRFGADIPKQYVEVKDRPVFSYILQGYNKLDFVDAIAVVANPDWFDLILDWKDKLKADKMIAPIAGGATRSESVKNGLDGISGIAGDDDVVLIHDATHPYVDAEGTREVMEAVREFGGATLGQYQFDTVYQIDEDTDLLEKVVPRKKIVSGASPEGFLYGDIHRIYTNSTEEELESMTSAGAIAIAHDIKMKVVKTKLINLKITYPPDMDTFRQLVDYNFPDQEF